MNSNVGVDRNVCSTGKARDKSQNDVNFFYEGGCVTAIRTALMGVMSSIVIK